MTDDEQLREAIEWARSQADYLRHEAGRLADELIGLANAIDQLEQRPMDDTARRVAEQLCSQSYYVTIAASDIARAVTSVGDYAKSIRSAR